MAVWQRKPHAAKFRRSKLFSDFYQEVFSDGLQPAHVLLSVLAFRMVENERKRPKARCRLASFRTLRTSSRWLWAIYCWRRPDSSETALLTRMCRGCERCSTRAPDSVQESRQQSAKGFESNRGQGRYATPSNRRAVSPRRPPRASAARTLSSTATTSKEDQGDLDGMANADRVRARSGSPALLGLAC